MPQFLDKKWVYLIIKGRYFKYKNKGHIAYDYSKKRKIVAILKGFIKDNIN